MERQTMADILTYFFLFALMALAVVAGVWVFKSYLNGQSPTSALFGPRPEKRLAVVEHASVDGRRRLILVRRDGVEHLIMTGGPVDVVIETGIGERKSRLEVVEPAQSAPVFNRQPRPFGQAAAERSVERTSERAAE
jgi:flagellar protein FliO/FliZ